MNFSVMLIQTGCQSPIFVVVFLEPQIVYFIGTNSDSHNYMALVFC